MGLGSRNAALYMAEIESQAQRLVRYPAAIGGVNIVSNGAAAAGAYCANYIQIVAAATIANPCWIVGLVLGVPVIEAFYGDIVIAIGAIAAEVDLVTVPVGLELFPVVEWTHSVIWLPTRVKVLNSPRLAVNIRKSTAASVAGFNNCAVLALTGVGT